MVQRKRDSQSLERLCCVSYELHPSMQPSLCVNPSLVIENNLWNNKYTCCRLNTEINNNNIYGVKPNSKKCIVSRIYKGTLSFRRWQIIRYNNYDTYKRLLRVLSSKELAKIVVVSYHSSTKQKGIKTRHCQYKFLCVTWILW